MIKNKEFFTQLDGLRCIAVLLTLIAHWFPAVNWPIVPYSWNGVDIFFVISGFLITLLLFRKKEEAAHSKTGIIKNFMVRRILRLFPLYYLFILFFFLTYKFFHIQWWIPKLGPYLFTYTSNIYYANNGIENGIFEHTWSLAVEEQFYLIWPWLVIFLSPKHFFKLLLSFILLAFFAHLFPATFKIIQFPPIKNFNTLGAGALLAYLVYYKNESVFYSKLDTFKMPLCIFFVVLYIFFVIYIPDGRYFDCTREIILTVAGLLLVFNTVAEWKGFFGTLLASKPFSYVGKISY